MSDVWFHDNVGSFTALPDLTSLAKGVPVYTSQWHWPDSGGFYGTPSQAGNDKGYIMLKPRQVKSIQSGLAGKGPIGYYAAWAWLSLVHEYTHAQGFEHSGSRAQTTEFYKQVGSNLKKIVNAAPINDKYRQWVLNRVGRILKTTDWHYLEGN